MSEVFDVGNGVPANFNDGTVEVSVNGTSKGRQRIQSGEKTGAFLKRMAKTYGVRTYSAYVDDHKLDTEDVAAGGDYENLNDAQKVSIVAKDSRG